MKRNRPTHSPDPPRGISCSSQKDKNKEADAAKSAKLNRGIEVDDLLTDKFALLDHSDALAKERDKLMTYNTILRSEKESLQSVSENNHDEKQRLVCVCEKLQLDVDIDVKLYQMENEKLNDDNEKLQVENPNLQSLAQTLLIDLATEKEKFRYEKLKNSREKEKLRDEYESAYAKQKDEFESEKKQLQSQIKNLRCEIDKSVKMKLDFSSGKEKLLCEIESLRRMVENDKTESEKEKDVEIRNLKQVIRQLEIEVAQLKEINFTGELRLAELKGKIDKLNAMTQELKDDTFKKIEVVEINGTENNIKNNVDPPNQVEIAKNSGVFCTVDQWKELCLCKTEGSLCKALMSVLFDDEQLKKCCFRGGSPTRPALDRQKVDALIECVQNKYPCYSKHKIIECVNNVQARMRRKDLEKSL